MKQKNIFVFLAVSIIMWAAIVVQSQRATAQSMTDAVWQEKVDGWVMQTAVDNQQTEFLVVLAAQADISPAADLSSKEEKGQFVYETLSQLAAETQAPIIAELEAMGVEYRAYWVNNMIWVRGDASVVQAMAARNDVARIDGNKPSRMDEPIQESSSILSPTATEWGTNRINAPAVWALGYDGTGIVVGGQDTGYRYTHETIANQYRGNGGSHDYNWHDSIHTTGSSCGADSPFPCDDHGHGTHTMGTMVGDDGGSNQVGVAPGAQWIGCRNMNAGVGTPATYSECFQWFIAPTQIDGSNPDPAMAPHVINNSWGCPDSEGCAWNSLQTVVSNTRAAGIIVVVSAGNAGSSCNTVNDPPAIYDDSYSVGSVTSTDAISSFSSRGPADDTGLPKPDISAPGSSIRSGSNSSDSSYMTISGTSMAGPHVAGAVALLLSRAPSLIGDQTAVENLLNTTADPQTTTQICGGVPGSSVPNNTFGWGIVNALTAVNATVIIDAPTTVTSTQMVDTQITETITISNAGIIDLHWNLYEDATTTCSGVNDITWLTTSSVNGTVAAGDEMEVDLIFNASGMSDGVYTADLCISSNDTTTPTTTIPLSMRVTNAPTTSTVFLPLITTPSISVASVLTPFDANTTDVYGPSYWRTRYGKSPEIIVSSNGTALDVLAQDYDSETAWSAVLLHIEPTSAGYVIGEAITNAPMLDRVMGLANDATGNLYYATGVDESDVVDPYYPPLDTYRSNIVRVVKLNPTGTVQFNIDLDTARHTFDNNAEMIINPMTFGSSRLAVGSNEIALVHSINTDPDWNINGARHQKALSTRLDATNGAITHVSSVWVSHSFDQRLLYDGTSIIETHLGDAYPRQIVFNRDHSPYPLLYIKGATGDNETHTRLGNSALIENDPTYGYISLFSTESSANTGGAINGARNLAIVRVNKSDNSIDPNLPDTLTVSSAGTSRTNRLRWLTSYSAASNLHAERPKLIGIGNDQYVVLWEEWLYTGSYYDTFNGVYGMVIDDEGNTLKAAALITDAHHLHRGDDAFLLDGRAAWMTGNGSEQKLYLHFVDANLNYEMVTID